MSAFDILLNKKRNLRAHDADTLYGVEGDEEYGKDEGLRIKGVYAPEMPFGKEPQPGARAGHETAKKYETEATTVLTGERGGRGRRLGDRVSDSTGRRLSHELLQRGQAVTGSGSDPQQVAIEREFRMAGAGTGVSSATEQQVSDFDIYQRNQAEYIQRLRDKSLPMGTSFKKGSMEARAVDRGVDQVQQMGYGLMKLVGDSFGSETISKLAKGGIDEQALMMMFNPRETKSWTASEGFADSVASLYESFIEQVPNIGVTIASAVATGGIGGIAARTAAARIAAGETVASKATATAFANAMKLGPVAPGRFVAEQGAKGYAKGAVIGASTASFGMNTGETKIGFDAEGIDNNSKVFFTGMVKAALDMAGLSKIPGFNRLAGMGARASGVAPKKLLKNVPFAVLKAAGAEGTTEAFQQVADIVAVNTSKDRPWSEEDTNSVIDAFVVGAVTGGVMGGGGSVAQVATDKLNEPSPESVPQTDPEPQVDIDAQTEVFDAGRKRALFVADDQISLPEGEKAQFSGTQEDGRYVVLLDSTQKGRTYFKSKADAQVYTDKVNDTSVEEANEVVLPEGAKPKTQVIAESEAAGTDPVVLVAANILDDGSVHSIAQEVLSTEADAPAMMEQLQQEFPDQTIERMSPEATLERRATVLEQERIARAEAEKPVTRAPTEEEQAEVDNPVLTPEQAAEVEPVSEGQAIDEQLTIIDEFKPDTGIEEQIAQQERRDKVPEHTLLDEQGQSREQIKLAKQASALLRKAEGKSAVRKIKKKKTLRKKPAVKKVAPKKVAPKKPAVMETLKAEAISIRQAIDALGRVITDEQVAKLNSLDEKLIVIRNKIKKLRTEKVLSKATKIGTIKELSAELNKEEYPEAKSCQGGACFAVADKILSKLKGLDIIADRQSIAAQQITETGETRTGDHAVVRFMFGGEVYIADIPQKEYMIYNVKNGTISLKSGVDGDNLKPTIMKYADFSSVYGAELNAPTSITITKQPRSMTDVIDTALAEDTDKYFSQFTEELRAQINKFKGKRAGFAKKNVERWTKVLEGIAPKKAAPKKVAPKKAAPKKAASKKVAPEKTAPLAFNKETTPRERIPLNKITSGIRGVFTKSSAIKAKGLFLDVVTPFRSSLARLKRVSTRLGLSYKKYQDRFHSDESQFKAETNNMYREHTEEELETGFVEYIHGEVKTEVGKKLESFFKKLVSNIQSSSVKHLQQIELINGRPYFPQIHQQDIIRDDKVGFVKFLLTGKEGKPFSYRGYDGKEYVMDVKAAKAITENLLSQSEGDSAGPQAGSTKRRTLTDPAYQAAAFDAGWLNKDPRAVIEMYISTMMRQKNYEETFGDYSVKGIDALPQVLRGYGYHFKEGDQKTYKKALDDAKRRGLVRDSELDKTLVYVWNASALKERSLESIKETKGEKEAAEAKKAMDAMDGLLGRELNPKIRKTMQWAVVVQAYTILAFSTLSSLPELGVMMAGTIGKDPEAAWKGLKQFMRDTTDYAKQISQGTSIKDARNQSMEMARLMGVIPDALTATGYLDSSDLEVQGNKPRAAMEKLFTYNLNILFNNSLRSISYNIGAEYFIKKAKAGDAEALARWDITIKDVLDWDKNGRQAFVKDGVALSAMGNAFLQFADHHVARPTSAVKPVFGNDPHFMLVSQLKSFFYAYGSVILPELGKTMANRYAKARRADKTHVLAGLNASLPLLVIGSMAMPLAYLSQELKASIRELADDDYEERRKEYLDKMGPGERLGDILRATGVLGPVDLMMSFYDAEQYGQSGIVRALGPTVGYLDTLVKYGPLSPEFMQRSAPILGVTSPGLWREWKQEARAERRKKRYNN